jgi:hypothetical protein
MGVGENITTMSPAATVLKWPAATPKEPELSGELPEELPGFLLCSDSPQTGTG